MALFGGMRGKGGGKARPAAKPAAKPARSPARKLARKLAAKASPEEVVSLALEGASLSVVLRRNPRSRRLTLRLSRPGKPPVITAPPATRTADAVRFLERHRGWLEERLEARPDLVPFVDGALVPLRGIPHRIAHRPGKRGTVWMEVGPAGPAGLTGPDETGTPLICVAGDAAHLARRLTDRLKREAKADLSAAVARHAATLERRVARIAVRDTASRWGSCSTSGTLSFSWRLVLAPPDILDYVAAHEVAHLVEMNHSPRFWRVVARLCPDFETARDWLRREGATLHTYGRGAEWGGD